MLSLLSSAALKAQYEGAPFIPTEGSDSYTNVANVINGWATSLNPSNNKAMDNRSAIINQVENTVTAAGKDLITDEEYDALADALYFWLNQVATEGRTAANPMIGWDMVDITLVNEADCPAGTQAVWRLCNDDVPIGNSTVVAHNNSRIVMFVSDVYYTGHESGHDVEPTTTPLGDVKITRGTSSSSRHANLFKTEGNGEIIFFGKSGHRIYADGSQGSWGNFPDPTSYAEVNGRTIPAIASTSDNYGQLVWVNSGRLLSSYTTFCNNVAGKGGGISYPLTVTNVNHFRTGGAVMFNGAVSTSAFYKSDFKNNAIAQQDGLSGSFGGAVGCGDITTLTDGIYFNQCDIVGNLNETHGGAFGFFFDGLGEGQANAGQLVIRDCNFQYNSQRTATESHGGGLFYRDTGRSCHLFNCTFDNNYAHGITAGGGAISNEGHIYINGCTFTNNMADNSFGGAIYTRPVMSLGFESKVIDIELDNCTFSNNKCTWTNNVENTEASDIERGSGGALHLDIYRTEGEPETVTYSCTLNIKGNTTFEENTADRNGGAIAIDMMQRMKEWASSHTSQITSNLNIKSATISGNTITDKSIGGGYYASVSKNGGAIYLTHTNLNVGELGSTETLVVKDNHTDGLGGAAYIYKGDLVLNSGNLGVSGHANKAPVGGGVYINEGSFTINGGNLGYNEATTGNGGGVYMTSGTFSSLGGSVEGNKANNGAGVYVESGSVDLKDVSIEHNIATAINGRGGGFYVSGGNVTMSGGNITKNEVSSGNGGAFYVNGGNVIINDGVISDNKSVSGGGVYVDGGNFTFTNGTISSNIAEFNGGGAYVSSGIVTFKGNLSGNTAANGGGLYLGPGASMDFQGGLIIENHADLPDGATPANTAYHGSSSNIMGCGGGIYLQNGTDGSHKTTLTFSLDSNDKTFGLYTNRADKAGDDVVAEGQYTEVLLPSVRDMQLYGFDGKDATPFWYQDYFLEDTGYDNTTADNGTHAVDGIVDHVDRFRDIIAKYTNDYLQHRIPDERLAAVKNNYLCLTLSYNMLDITLTANNLEGSETALFQLVRHGSTNDYKYDVLLKKGSDGKASRTLRNMPWGTYSVIPNDSWNWAYDRIDPKYNFRLGETGNYEFVFDMLHHNNAETPRHDETQPQ